MFDNGELLDSVMKPVVTGLMRRYFKLTVIDKCFLQR